MLSIKTSAGTLSAWFAITFVLCIGWCGIAPDGWHARELLELMLPGFVWLTAGSFVLGLVESALFGAYSGVLFAVLHNASAKLESQRER